MSEGIGAMECWSNGRDEPPGRPSTSARRRWRLTSMPITPALQYSTEIVPTHRLCQPLLLQQPYRTYRKARHDSIIGVKRWAHPGNDTTDENVRSTVGHLIGRYIVSYRAHLPWRRHPDALEGSRMDPLGCGASACDHLRWRAFYCSRIYCHF